MMKRSYLFLLLLIGMLSCSEDENTNSDNFISGDENYQIEAAYFEPCGMIQDSLFFSSLSITSGVNVVIEDNKISDVSGDGFVLQIDFVSRTKLLNNGTYNAKGFLGMKSQGIVEVGDMQASYCPSFSAEGQEWLAMEYGSLSLDQTGSIYKISFMFVDVNDSIVQGRYEGPLTILKDQPKEMFSYLEAEEKYELIDAVEQYDGKLTDKKYYFETAFVAPEMEVVFSDNNVMEGFEGNGFVVKADFISDSCLFEDGIYDICTFSKKTSEVKVLSAEAKYQLNYKEGDENWISFNSGSIEVLTIADSKMYTFNLTDKDGKVFKGTYKGPSKVIDASDFVTPGEDNYVTIEKKHAIKQGIIETCGLVKEGLYDTDISLATKDIKFVIEDYNYSETEGTGFILDMDFISSERMLKEGVYRLKELVDDDDNLLAEDGIFTAEYAPAYDSESDNWVDLTDGTVTVSKDGEDYILEMEMTDAYDKKLTGYYSGKLEHVENDVLSSVLVQGTWLYESRTINGNNILDECEKDDELVFAIDGSYNITVNEVCEYGDGDIVNEWWSEGTILTINDTDGEEVHVATNITDDRVVLQVVFDIGGQIFKKETILRKKQ